MVERGPVSPSVAAQQFDFSARLFVVWNVAADDKASAGFDLAMVQCVCRSFPGAVCDRKFQNAASLYSRRIQRRAQNLLLSIVCDRNRDAFAAILQHRSVEQILAVLRRDLRPSHGCDVAVRAAGSSCAPRDQMTSNQTMKPTAPDSMIAPMFATTLSTSSRLPASLVRLASWRSRTPAVLLCNDSGGLSLSR